MVSTDTGGRSGQGGEQGEGPKNARSVFHEKKWGSGLLLSNPLAWGIDILRGFHAWPLLLFPF